jgi:hypothetical protein
MAHFPKPFFRPARGVWYVQIDERQHNLGPDEAAAFKAYHALMQHRDEFPKQSAPLAGRQLVVVVVDAFLDWCEKNRAPDTYSW